MKKKLMAMLIAACMTATVLAGCGKEEETTGNNIESSVDKSEEEANNTSVQTEAKESEVESTEETVVESTEETVVESTEAESTESESTEEAVVENKEEETTEEQNTVDVVDADGKDWSKAYDKYFENIDMLSENTKMTASTLADGMSFDLTIAVTKDVMWMGYDFGTVAFDMYVDKDKVYACTEMEGQASWVWAPVTADNQASSITDMADTSAINTENIENVTYRESIEDNGVIYDVLDVTINNEGSQQTAVYFINRATQKVEKCVMEQEGQSVVCILEEIESVEIPAESANATEATMEDIIGSMLGVLFMSAGMGME